MMKAEKDLTNQKIGKLLVIERAPDYYQPSGRRIVKWNCLCDCGNSTTVRSEYLKPEKNPCCPVCGRMKAGNSRRNDLTGQQFGELTVLSLIPDHSQHLKWRCRCSCGEIIAVQGSNLVSGNTTRCMKCRTKVIAEKKLINLSGKTFGRWKVLQRDSQTSLDGTYWKCQCECGKVKSVLSRNLISGKSISCGCYRAENPSTALDLQGMRFGKLIVESLSAERKDSFRLWNCKCDCGGSITVRSHSLINGDTSSCGCYHKERISELFTKDLTGQRFGKLVVVRRAVGDFGHAYWECICDCGNVVLAVDGYNLTHGHTMSCGCINSKLERWVTEYLLSQGYESGIDFDVHKKFTEDDLRGVGDGYLSYDFCIYDKDSVGEKCIKYLIECQGEQHYRPVELFGGEQQFEIQKMLASGDFSQIISG